MINSRENSIQEERNLVRILIWNRKFKVHKIKVEMNTNHIQYFSVIKVVRKLYKASIYYDYNLVPFITDTGITLRYDYKNEIQMTDYFLSAQMNEASNYFLLFVVYTFSEHLLFQHTVPIVGTF